MVDAGGQGGAGSVANPEMMAQEDATWRWICAGVYRSNYIQALNQVVHLLVGEQDILDKELAEAGVVEQHLLLV